MYICDVRVITYAWQLGLIMCVFDEGVIMYVCDVNVVMYTCRCDVGIVRIICDIVVKCMFVMWAICLAIIGSERPFYRQAVVYKWRI